MDRLGRAAVVVGVNGSPASAAALRWAAAEAQRRHARLRVVRSWETELNSAGLAAGVQMAPEQHRAAAAAGLAAEVRAAFGAQVPDNVTAELAEGLAERVLADRSADADLLVLGSAAPPGPTARSIGPVVRTCLSRARCPVVVICPDRQAGPASAPPVLSRPESVREHDRAGGTPDVLWAMRPDHFDGHPDDVAESG